MALVRFAPMLITPHRPCGQHGTLGQGGDPSHGARGAEIKAIQAAC